MMNKKKQDDQIEIRPLLKVNDHANLTKKTHLYQNLIIYHKSLNVNIRIRKKNPFAKPGHSPESFPFAFFIVFSKNFSTFPANNRIKPENISPV